MRKNLYFFVLFFVLFVACEQEVYDKGDGNYSYMRADFVEAFVNGSQQVEYVITDDDERIQLTKAYSAKWIQRPDTTYRAVLYYNNEGSKAEAINLAQVTTVTIKKSAYYKGGVKTDPLGMESIWISGNKKYLNLCLILKTGAVDDEKIVQTLGVVSDTITTGSDGLHTCYLRVFHNQGGVPQYYSQRVYFSVPVSDLMADSLRLSLNTYDGLVEKGFCLKP